MEFLTIVVAVVALAGVFAAARARARERLTLPPGAGDSPNRSEAVLQDATGTVPVIADQIELAIRTGHAWWLGELPIEVQRGLSAVDYPWAVVREGVLVDGAPVVVGGYVSRELLPTSYRDGESTLVLRASPTFPLVASSDSDLFTPTDRPIAAEWLRSAD